MEYDALVRRLAGKDEALAESVRAAYPSLPALLRAAPRDLRARGVPDDVSSLPAVIFAVMRRERLDALTHLRIRGRGEANALCAWFLSPEKLPASVLVPLDAKGNILPPRILSRGRKYTMYELIDVILEEMRAADASKFVLGVQYDAAIPENKVPYVADADRLFRAICPLGLELFDYVLCAGGDAFSVMRWMLG